MMLVMNNSNRADKALSDAIGLLGGPTAAGKLLCVTQGAVSQWLRSGLPPRRVVSLEQAVINKIGGEEARRRGLTRYELSPEFYPRDQINRGAA